jgi:hypothetical protein
MNLSILKIFDTVPIEIMVCDSVTGDMSKNTVMNRTTPIQTSPQSSNRLKTQQLSTQIGGCSHGQMRRWPLPRIRRGGLPL